MKRNFIKFWVPVYLYAGLIFTLYSIPNPLPFTPRILSFDKILHVVEFAILGVLLARAFKNSNKKILQFNFRLLAICATVFYGITDELHQVFVPNRYASIWDLLFDGLGATVGAYVIKSDLKRKK